MPRTLPWQKGSGTRTQTKQTPRPAKKQRRTLDIDDDFFTGTVLEISRKGKERAEQRGQSDDDDDLPTTRTRTTATPLNKTVNREPTSRSRAPSSSPPPVADLSSPQVEFMEKGTSKFDLRDDEWMMVEDEFLQTAKLFTQHLHLAEYEQLRKTIDEKKQNAEIARPVIPNAKPSEEGSVRMKLMAQEKKQRKAIRDVIASVNDEDEQDDMTTRERPESSKLTTSSAGPSRFTPTVPRRILSEPSRTDDASDSDDLDAIPRRRSTMPRPAAAAPTLTTTLSGAPKPFESTRTQTNTNPKPSAFARPPVPSFPSSKSMVTKINRATPFDMLDDYTPTKPNSSPLSPPSNQSIIRDSKVTSPTKRSILLPKTLQQETLSTKTSTSTQLEKAKTPARSMDLFDELDFGAPRTSGLSKETAARLAKRKAEKEKEKEQEKGNKAKKKPVALDDIPTFLF